MQGEHCLFVVSGPSGAGKDTVVEHLRAAHPAVQRTVSATTRAMRPGDEDGVTYHFISTSEFEQKLKENALVEYTNYCGNYYGTLRSETEPRMAAGIPVILVIEVEGAGNIKRLYPGATTVFVMPPSLEELERRLRGRGTESEDKIQKRLARAQQEMALAASYDEHVVNDDIDRCAADLYAIIERQLQQNSDT